MCDNINITKNCRPRQQVIVLFIHFTDHFQEEITSAVEISFQLYSLFKF